MRAGRTGGGMVRKSRATGIGVSAKAIAGLFALLLCWAGPLRASFHLFLFDEMFSDASGNVQYVVLSTVSCCQQLLSGNQVIASQGSAMHSYTFTTNLSGDTTGKKILIATQGFA